MWDFHLPLTMRTKGDQSNILWLGPLLLGLLTGPLPYLIDHSFFNESSLIGPVTVTACIAICFPFLSNSVSNRKLEMMIGIWTGMAIAYLPILFFFVWIVIPFLYWIWETANRDNWVLPPFRIGLWIGCGIISGIYISNIIAYNLL